MVLKDLEDNKTYDKETNIVVNNELGRNKADNSEKSQDNIQEMEKAASSEELLDVSSISTISNLSTSAVKL